MTTLFIADLHLSEQRPEITKIFLHFLQNKARHCRALYILGDLFEAWLGDDCILPAYQPILQAIQELTKNNVAVYFIHGNRDFLIGQHFCDLTGCTLLDESTVINIDNKEYLIMHGDTLCTDDVKYQQFRSMVRDPQWQQQLLEKTPAERIALAKQFREMSETETAGKTNEIMDVNQTEVEKVMQATSINTLIHVHTHRPNIHEFTLGGKPAQRIVLGDWYQHGSVLSLDNGHFEIQEFS